MSLAVCIRLAAPSRLLRALRLGARLLVTMALGLTAWALYTRAIAPPSVVERDGDFPSSLWWLVLATLGTVVALGFTRRGAGFRLVSKGGAWPPFAATRIVDGEFAIDDKGSAFWLRAGRLEPAPNNRQLDPASSMAWPERVPLSVQDAYVGQWLISLRVVPGRLSGSPGAAGTGPGRRPQRPGVQHVLIARDAVSPDQWRRLRVWAIWRLRGGGAAVVL